MGWQIKLGRQTALDEANLFRAGITVGRKVTFGADKFILGGKYVLDDKLP